MAVALFAARNVIEAAVLRSRYIWPVPPGLRWTFRLVIPSPVEPPVPRPPRGPLPPGRPAARADCQLRRLGALVGSALDLRTSLGTTRLPGVGVLTLGDTMVLRVVATKDMIGSAVA